MLYDSHIYFLRHFLTSRNIFTMHDTSAVEQNYAYCLQTKSTLFALFFSVGDDSDFYYKDCCFVMISHQQTYASSHIIINYIKFSSTSSCCKRSVNPPPNQKPWANFAETSCMTKFSVRTVKHNPIAFLHFFPFLVLLTVDLNEYQDIDFSDFSSASDMNKWQEQCWMPLLTNYKFPFQFSPFCN